MTATNTTAGTASSDSDRAQTKYPIVPFSDDVPTHPLLIVDSKAIQAGDADAIATLYCACSELGFFYLKNHGLDPEPIFAIGEATFDLPLEELMQFEQGDSGMSAGYKKAGSTNVDKEGNVDTAQFINIAKDDALHYPEARQRTYPRTVMANMEVYRHFTREADNVGQALLEALEGPLGLPKGTLRKLHPDDMLSGSETRCIKKPAVGERGYLAEGNKGNVQGASIGAHTDFGSLSILFNRGIGGLQVLPPGTTEWQFIKPLDGHAVCNVGDTLSVYSGGLLRSNTHRVVPPPPPQDKYTRWSSVFFLRPAFEHELYPLGELSPKIAAAQAAHPTMSKLEKDITAGQWFKRRVVGQRAANRKGPEDWLKSRGTEHTPDAA